MPAFVLMTIQSLVAMLDQFTPCLVGVNSKKERRNLSRIEKLVTVIIEVTTQSFTPTDCARVVDALLFAALKHTIGNKKGRRADGITPYLLHPLEVVHFLIVLGVRNLDILIAAVIHDTMEDSGATKKEIISRFGMNVYKIVKLLSKHPDKNLEMFYWDDMKNEPDLFIRMCAIIVKFPDRGHSLRTLGGLESSRRRRILEETKREFPELHRVLKETLEALPVEKKAGLPDDLAPKLHTLVFGRLTKK